MVKRIQILSSLVLAVNVVIVHANPLLDAVKKQDYVRIDTLLRSSLFDESVNVDEQDEYGNTALHYAVKNNDCWACEILCHYGADRTIKNGEGFSPIYLGLCYESFDALETVLQFGYRGNLFDFPEGRPPFHCAYLFAGLRGLEILATFARDNCPHELEGAYDEYQDFKKKTLYDYARDAGQVQQVRALL